MELNKIETLANDLIASHEIIMKNNEEKKKQVNKQIEKRAMQLFDHLFLNQIKLIKQNTKIENELNLKSIELKNSLRKLIQKETTTKEMVEEHIKAINQIKQELNNLHYDYYFETDQTLESNLNIGKLVTNFYVSNEIFLLYIF